MGASMGASMGAVVGRKGVLVMGDGPAGCAAAIAAARAGCAVRMVGMGRERAVPECASREALRLLAWLAPELLAQAGIWLDAPAAPGAAWQLSRALDRAGLDRALRVLAMRAGVDYARPVLLASAADGIEADAWVVIDASGVNGWLRRHRGLPETVASRPWWLQRGHAVAGQGKRAAHGTHFAIGGQGWLWLKATSHGWIWTALSGARDDGVPWPAGMAPVGQVWRECRRWRHLHCAAGPGYFVCGDAAGYLDPATGDGLRFALESGARAGALAASVVRWPARATAAAALYADWALQTHLCRQAALAEVYARASLQVA